MSQEAERTEEPKSLGELLDRLENAVRDQDRVSLETVIRAAGRRSFAPVVLVGGLMTFSPLSGIPGVPTLVGVLIALVAGQLVFQREHFWLPAWLLRRSVSQRRFLQAVHFLRRPAHWADSLLRPRWTALTYSVGTYLIALLCLLLALALPPMELVPFSSSGAGAALTAFGLALITHDGVAGLIAALLATVTIGLGTFALISGAS